MATVKLNAGFNDPCVRANSTTSPGGPWSTLAGVFGISTNQLYAPSGGSIHGDTEAIALADVGTSDLDISWDMQQGNATQQVDFFIASDASNTNAVDCLFDSGTNLAYIYELDNGTFSGNTSAAFVVNTATTYRCRAVKSGTSVQFYINGTLVVSRTLSKSYTGTYVGPRANFYTGNNAANNRWGNIVLAGTPGGTATASGSLTSFKHRLEGSIGAMVDRFYGTDGSAVLTSPGGRPWASGFTYQNNRAIDLTGSANFTNLDTGSATQDVSATFYSGSSTDHRVRLYFCLDSGNAAVGYFLELANSTITLASRSPSISTLGTTSITMANNTLYTIRCTRSGSSVKAYVNGVLQLSVTNSSFTSQTYAGFQTFYADQYVDDFTVITSGGGVATVSGSLDRRKSLAGTSAGQGVVTGAMSRQRRLAAKFAPGPNDIVLRPAPTAPANATLAANALVSVAGVALVVGALTNLGQAVSAVSTAGATVTATLRRARPIASSVAGVSTVQGAFPVGSQQALAATCAGSASVAGAMVRTFHLAAAVSGAATVANAVSLTRPLSSSSSCAGLAALSSALALVTPLATSTSGVATTTGALVRTRGLTSAATGQSTATAAIALARTLSSSSAGSATVVAPLGRTRRMVGTAHATATTSGALARTSRLTVTMHGVSTVPGPQDLPAPELTVSRTLAATVTAHASATASALRIQRVAATSHGVATASGAERTHAALRGASAGTALTQASAPDLSRGLLGGATAAGQAHVTLKLIVGLESDVAGSTSVDVALSRIVQFAGQSDGLATVTVPLGINQPNLAVLALKAAEPLMKMLAAKPKMVLTMLTRGANLSVSEPKMSMLQEEVV